MKVLLISANRLTAPYPVYPLGIDHVAQAICRAHDVRVVDINTTDLAVGLPQVIAEFRPEVVGLSLRNVDNTDHTDPKGFVGFYRKCADTIRAHCDATLVLGGSAFTLFPMEMIAALGADFGIVGEGERLLLFLDALTAGENPAAIDGVVAPGGDGQIPVPWQQPFGCTVAKNSTRRAFYLERGGILNLQTKRGCPFGCIYCTYPHIEGNRLRSVSPEDAARQAVALERAGARFLFITDSTFNADHGHSADVARAFMAAGLSIPWGAFFSPTRFPPGYFRLLADAGLTHVEFGTESLSDRVLEAYKKPFRRQHVFAAHKAAVDAGLYVAHYFLLGGPGESRASLEVTLSNVDKLLKTVLFFFCGLRIYPNTGLYDLALDSGQISSRQSLLEPVFFRPRSLSLDEVAAMVERRAAGRPNWVVGAGGDDTADILARMYRRGFSGPLWEYLIR